MIYLDNLILNDMKRTTSASRELQVQKNRLQTLSRLLISHCCKFHLRKKREELVILSGRWKSREFSILDLIPL